MLDEIITTNPKLYYTVGIILWLIITEIIYFFSVKNKLIERERNQGLLSYSVNMKFISAIFSIFLVGCIGLIMDYFREVLITLGVIVIIIAFFWINYLLTKKVYTKKRTKK